MNSRGCMSDAFPPSWLVPSRGAQETQLIKAKLTSESTLIICLLEIGEMVISAFIDS